MRAALDKKMFGPSLGDLEIAGVVVFAGSRAALVTTSRIVTVDGGETAG